MRNDSEDQLQEAAECVRLLIACLKEHRRARCTTTGRCAAWLYTAEARDAYLALPAWLRRDIEKG